MRKYIKDGFEINLPDKLDLIESEYPKLYVKSSATELASVVIELYKSDESFNDKKRALLWTQVMKNHPLMDSQIHCKEEVKSPYQGVICVLAHQNKRTQQHIYEFMAEFVLAKDYYVSLLIKDEGLYEELHERWLEVISSIQYVSNET